MDKSLAKSTASAYHRYWLKYESFCNEIGRSPNKFRNSVIIMWLTRLYQDKLTYGSILSHLSGLRHYCIKKNIRANLDTGSIRMTLSGIKKDSPLPKKRGVVTRGHLKRLRCASQATLNNSNHVEFVAMVTMAFYGFLRPSEYCISEAGHHLSFGAIKLGRKKRSYIMKFNTYKHAVSRNRVEVNHQTVECPVKAFLAYRKITPFAASAPLFNVTCQEFRQRLQEVRKAAGIRTKLTPHSFRHGGATWASRQGWSDARIRAHGRWKSGAYRSYVRDC